MVPVGFHRYVIENLSDNTSEGLNEKEVEEFDPPSEVSSRVLIVHLGR
jgi:xylulokinase